MDDIILVPFEDKSFRGKKKPIGVPQNTRNMEYLMEKLNIYSEDNPQPADEEEAVEAEDVAIRDIYGNLTVHGDLVARDSFRGATSLWYRADCVSAFSVSPGASGATWTAPDANTLGGYQLNAVGEKLYLNESITSMWDGASDLSFRVTWECNVDNTGGADADTVDLQLVCYYKGNAETANKTQTLEEAKTVGKSARYKRFTTVFTIDWDKTSNVVEVADKISFILNLETDTSEVDDIIVNTIMFRYKTTMMNPEV